jgi:predicted nucleic acid-binding protein
VQIVPVDLMTATVSVLDRARGQQLSAYDAAYLDLAYFRNVPLATLDLRLRAAAERSGIDVLD